MADTDFDQVAQLRKLGIGGVIGGILLLPLSFITSETPAVGGLLVLGILVWIWEYQRNALVGIGIGIGLVGVVGALEATTEVELSLFELGIFDRWWCTGVCACSRV